MNTTNFTDILKRPASDIERPKSLPAGTYLAVVKGQPRQDKSEKKKTPFVEFTLALLAAEEDVDQEELTSALTDKAGKVTPLTDKTMKATYYITEGSAWRLKDFLGHLGFDTESDASMEQIISETPGSQVYINLRHKASEDGKTVFAEIASTAKVGE